MTELSQGLLDYHQRSKHRVDHYAPGPRGLDWANQPDPFREFPGAARHKLPLAADSLATRYNELRQGDLPLARRFDLDHLAVLFELSLGLSAWKSHGAHWWALESTTIHGKTCITSPWAARSTMPGSPHCRRTSFNPEEKVAGAALYGSPGFLAKNKHVVCSLCDHPTGLLRSS